MDASDISYLRVPHNFTDEYGYPFFLFGNCLWFLILIFNSTLIIRDKEKHVIALQVTHGRSVLGKKFEMLTSLVDSLFPQELYGEDSRRIGFEFCAVHMSCYNRYAEQVSRFCFLYDVLPDLAFARVLMHHLIYTLTDYKKRVKMVESESIIFRECPIWLKKLQGIQHAMSS